jgi:hypothetical protein
LAVAFLATVFFVVVSGGAAEAEAPHRILVDTDMDTDDLFALLYLLKQNRSEFELKVRASLSSLNQHVTRRGLLLLA